MKEWQNDDDDHCNHKHMSSWNEPLCVYGVWHATVHQRQREKNGLPKNVLHESRMGRQNEKIHLITLSLSILAIFSHHHFSHKTQEHLPTSHAWSVVPYSSHITTFSHTPFSLLRLLSRDETKQQDIPSCYVSSGKDTSISYLHHRLLYSSLWWCCLLCLLTTPIHDSFIT